MTERGPGPGRWIDVQPERLTRWVESFAARHGALAAEPGPAGAVIRAADGASADCRVPFPPLETGSPAGPAAGRAGPATPPADGAGPAGPLADAGDPAAGAGTAAAIGLAAVMAAHAAAGRTVGVLLVRLGGYAAGVFTGAPPALAASKTGSRLVHGRSAAGGWSQQRFARRREQQAASALSAAADTAARVFAPYEGRLDAVVLGGDRRAVAGLSGDPRLRPYLALAVERFLTVPDPRLAVLRDCGRLLRAVQIRVAEPPVPGPPAG
ncbi:MAG: acVLRF1 family peptidyl-tRNA hydrolase [Gemmatimonadota bacterium]